MRRRERIAILVATIGLGLWISSIERVPSAQAEVGRIAYVGGDPGGPTQVFTIRPDGSGKQQLTRDPAAKAFAAWSRDRRTIAFTSLMTGSPEIWVIDAGGGNARQLTSPPASGNFVPTWSPDGTRIAFASVRSGHPEIWVMNADGTGQRQLTVTTSPGGSNAPSWSPDGSRIAFASDRSGRTEIYTMTPEGRDVRQLTMPTGAMFPDSNVPVWSPDGTKIAYWSGIERQFGQIWVMNTDGSGRHPLTSCPPPTNCDNPAWSPDGAAIIFETNRSGPASTWIMRSDGDDQQQLFPFPYGAGRLPW